MVSNALMRSTKMSRALGVHESDRADQPHDPRSIVEVAKQATVPRTCECGGHEFLIAAPEQSSGIVLHGEFHRKVQERSYLGSGKEQSVIFTVEAVSCRTGRAEAPEAKRCAVTRMHPTAVGDGYYTRKARIRRDCADPKRGSGCFSAERCDQQHQQPAEGRH